MYGIVRVSIEQMGKRIPIQKKISNNVSIWLPKFCYIICIIIANPTPQAYLVKTLLFIIVVYYYLFHHQVLVKIGNVYEEEFKNIILRNFKVKKMETFTEKKGNKLGLSCAKLKLG